MAGREESQKPDMKKLHKLWRIKAARYLLNQFDLLWLLGWVLHSCEVSSTPSIARLNQSFQNHKLIPPHLIAILWSAFVPRPGTKPLFTSSEQENTIKQTNILVWAEQESSNTRSANTNTQTQGEGPTSPNHPTCYRATNQSSTTGGLHAIPWSNYNTCQLFTNVFSGTGITELC